MATKKPGNGKKSMAGSKNKTRRPGAGRRPEKQKAAILEKNRKLALKIIKKYRVLNDALFDICDKNGTTSRTFSRWLENELSDLSSEFEAAKDYRVERRDAQRERIGQKAADRLEEGLDRLSQKEISESTSVKEKIDGDGKSKEAGKQINSRDPKSDVALIKLGLEYADRLKQKVEHNHTGKIDSDIVVTFIDPETVDSESGESEGENE